MEVVNNGANYLPGDPMLVDHIVYELKSQGIFDKFRKECIADVDTKPAYQNLRQRVEGSVVGFLRNKKWSPDMNKNQVREMLRKNISESGFLETGVERIVDQVVNPKINSVFLPQVEEVVYKFLGIKRGGKDEEVKKEVKVEEKDVGSPGGTVPECASDEKKEETNVDTKESEMDDSKIDEDESPPFEPLEENSPYAPPEDSVDSHMSTVSGLDSNHSHDIVSKVIAMEISQDSQTSKQSSDSHLTIAVSEEESKLDESKCKPNESNGGKHFDFDNADKHDKEKKSSKHRSSSSSHDKRDKRGKEKERERSRHSKESSSKDRSKSDKSKSQSSSKSHDKKRHESKSDHKKESTSSTKTKDKEDSRSKSHKHSSSSSSRSSRKDDKTKEKEKEREKRHESTHKYKRDKSDNKKKKESKDDHYSYKDKSRNNHRSTDGDSSDGHSGPSNSSSRNDSNSAQSQKPSESTNLTAGDTSSAGNSDQTELPIKLIKPKFASNIFEARRLMKIRRKLKKIEMQNKMVVEANENHQELQTVPKESWDAIEAKLNMENQIDYNAYEETERKSDELLFFNDEDKKQSNNYLKFSGDYIKTLQEDFTKFSNSNKELYEGVTKPTLEIDFTLSPTRGLKRKMSPQIENVLKINKKINKVFGKKKVENSVLVPVQCDFNLPLSPAESDQSNDTIEMKKATVRATGKATQRYDSDDLYKPRLNFTSSRRRVYKE